MEDEAKAAFQNGNGRGSFVSADGRQIVKENEEMRTLKLSLAALLILCTAGALAQEKTIKHVTAKPTSAASGKEMFTSYCASCHGTDGKGGGPASSALKVPPTDLTQLAKQNGGKFPALHVAAVLRGEATTPAHGSKDMPVWGPVFWQMSQGHNSEVQQRITNLTQFIESLQAK